MKTIIITGAAHGVGKAIVSLLSDHTLILIDKDAKALEETSNLYKADYFVCDVSKPDQIKDTLSMILKEYPVIDCLINNAGLWIDGDLSKLDDEYLNQLNSLDYISSVINTNLFGCIAMTRELSPVMIKQGYGQIININSQSGVKVESPYPIYNASKTGATAFRKAIQDDLGKHNIKITDICPGLISTDFYKHAGKDLPDFVHDLGLSAEDVANTVKYILDLPEHICIPSLELMNIKSW